MTNEQTKNKANELKSYIEFLQAVYRNMTFTDTAIIDGTKFTKDSLKNTIESLTYKWYDLWLTSKGV